MFAVQFRDRLPPEVTAELDQFFAQLNAFLGTSFDDTGTLLTQVTTAVGATRDIPTGAIFPYGGSSAPAGYLLCDGSTVSRSTYAGLFAVIGTTYGNGDGSTTFNIPDCRGRFLFGKATSGTGSTLGTTFGAVDHTHTGPSHTHTSTTVNVTVSGAQPVATSPTNAAGSGNTGSANPPGLVVTYIIRTGL